MTLSPYSAYSHLNESLAGYLDTAYKLAHSDLVAERRELLADVGRISQLPLIESTPDYPAGRFLSEVVTTHSETFPLELPDLMGFGSPITKRPLYRHQDELLEAVAHGRRSAVIATGTGSGKTEMFLLPVFGDLLREARSWPQVTRPAQPGRWERSTDSWIHSRRHETRPAAVRALILYPMNALVNDQLRRLRRIVGSAASEQWQLQRLHGNRIYFGMYTSETPPTGHWSNPRRRTQWDNAVGDFTAAWNALSDELAATGGWPRPNGPEMLARWDMQLSPPDVLITNYSMLEYMLLRPIEAPLFDQTRNWLRRSDSYFTLVLDEAHTYSGARGTEIAHLIRRLKDRLGLAPDDPRFHCVATSASLPASPAARGRIRSFAADLFGQPESEFEVITAEFDNAVPPLQPQLADLEAYAEFSRGFDLADPLPAIEALSQKLNIGSPDHTVDPSVAAYNLFRGHIHVDRLRAVTARHATRIDRLADLLWQAVGSPEDRGAATAGVLAIGSFARPDPDPDEQPLLSSRLHAMFRGIPGLWACMDPDCSAVPPQFHLRQDRPVGRLWPEPRVWCECDARVLEAFTCRVCGLLFLGGIPSANGSLWPWTDDLEGGRQDFNDYQIFGVEAPYPGALTDYRSIRTTQPVGPNDPAARITFPVTGANVSGRPIPFPAGCPRCNTRRGRGIEGREIVEPLRTKGSKSFSVLFEESFRLQPMVSNSATNGGRKALAFSDSRMDAAMLAGDLEIDHNRDLFRQIFYRLLSSCPQCLGYGVLLRPVAFFGPVPGPSPTSMPCTNCAGTGQVDARALSVDELIRDGLALAHRARIDPTLGEVTNYYAQLTGFHNPNEVEARRHLAAYIRNEITSADFGLEPMALAAWRPVMPPAESVGGLVPLTAVETIELLQVVIRLIAMQDAVLPPTLDPNDWPQLYVRHWDRQLIVPRGAAGPSHTFEFRTDGNTKLGRFLRSVGRRLVTTGRLLDEVAADTWQLNIEQPLLQLLIELRVLVLARTGVGYGICIDRFQLAPLGTEVCVCTACGYVMATTLLEVCARCGAATEARLPGSIGSFYRRIVQLAKPPTPWPDPFPFQVQEHTAAIERREAKQYERWFQGLFLPSEEPDDRRIDALSVTTTMEMGIDIGSLLSVGLRNIPPTVANYQQRAGRAGRRGNALATVVSFALPRSHDQYYFAHPEAIISDPPAVPRLYLDNRIIAQRHARAAVLQLFFHQWPPTSTGTAAGLLSAWGSIGDFQTQNGVDDLRAFVTLNRVPLRQRLSALVPAFDAETEGWITQLPDEVGGICALRPWGGDLLVELLNAALLPRHAFPIDVVALWTGPAQVGMAYGERGVQRDLGIALSEFAPGGEIVLRKSIYRVAGLYDRYQQNPAYVATDRFVECRTCRAVHVVDINDPVPATCDVCLGTDIRAVAMLRPPGFCTDWAQQPHGERYAGGGRDRVGYATPARLAVGEYSFQGPPSGISPRLFVRVRTGQLQTVNVGQDPLAPGFRICPACGRSLEPNDSVHNVPADIPPHAGPRMGPRAGQRCRTANPTQDRVILGHDFPSEVILLGVDLPNTMDANITTPVGRAVWLSFGTLVANAAANVLNINPDELRVGVRAVLRPGNRLLGEVFLYDTLPGGAGYAREIESRLLDVLQHARELGRQCIEPTCPGACYSCLLDYRNQWDHPLLDRFLGLGVVNYILDGSQPQLSAADSDDAVRPLRAMLRDLVRVEEATAVNSVHVSMVIAQGATRVGVIPIHSLAAMPEAGVLRPLRAAGIDPRPLRVFDLLRRPFWVMNQLGL